MATSTFGNDYFMPPHIFGNLPDSPADSTIYEFFNNNASGGIGFDLPVIAEPITNGSSVRYRPSEKKALIDDSDEDDDSCDSEGWKEKPIELWNENDTKSWLSDASIKIGQLYHQISPKLVMTGVNLLLLTIEEWLGYDDKFGKQLHDLLQCERKDRLNGTPIVDLDVPLDELEIDTLLKGITPQGSDSSPSDEDSDPTPSKPPVRRAGRPPKVKTQKERNPKIWEFIRDLLLDPSTCPQWIRWDDYKNKVFQFIESQKVAQRWGQRKGNEDMNFEKFSRLMRYYYKKKYLEPVSGRRLVYKFGPMATGLETSNPNFTNEPTIGLDLDQFRSSSSLSWYS